jgi:hypothetical protein
MHSGQTIAHSVVQEVEGGHRCITSVLLCLRELLLPVSVLCVGAHAGSENTTIVDVCVDYLEAEEVGKEAAIVAKWEKHLPPMASKVDVRVTNVPPYLRTMVKVQDAYIISE